VFGSVLPGVGVCYPDVFGSVLPRCVFGSSNTHTMCVLPRCVWVCVTRCVLPRCVWVRVTRCGSVLPRCVWVMNVWALGFELMGFHSYRVYMCATRCVCYPDVFGSVLPDVCVTQMCLVWVLNLWAFTPTVSV